jgi:asparagine synthase (glutamine-hydrolysing)
VVFASHLADLLAMADVPRGLDERMIANFLALNHLEAETTFYLGIRRVPTRSVARITPAGAEWHRYWSPNLDAPPPYRSDADYVARARELFDRAVARALRDTKRAAIQLSGGLDSSAVAATAVRLGLAPLEAYTGVPPAALDRPARPGWYLDERPKVEALMRMYPDLRVRFITPRGAHWRQSDPARFFAEIPLASRGTGNLGWFAQIDDAIAADRHAVVLNGAMGNMTTSWDGRFSLASLVRQGRLLRAAKEARALARATGQSLPDVAMSQGLMALLSPAAQRGVARLRGKATDDVSGFSLLAPAVIDALALRRQWHADGYDPTYGVHGTSAGLRAAMIYDAFQIGRDFAGMRHAGGRGDIRSPFFDRDLVTFCLSVPEALYRRDGVSRWFARAIFADRLPRAILDETKRGEQAPNWFESLDARKPAIAAELERLAASRLAARLIDLPRARRLVTDWPKDAREAQSRMNEYRYALDRAVHVGAFIRWVEGGNG